MVETFTYSSFAKSLSRDRCCAAVKTTLDNDAVTEDRIVARRHFADVKHRYTRVADTRSSPFVTLLFVEFHVIKSATREQDGFVLSRGQGNRVQCLQSRH